MDYVVLHFWLARTLPWLQQGFLIKTAQFLLFTVGARPAVVRHLPAEAARGDEVSTVGEARGCPNRARNQLGPFARLEKGSSSLPSQFNYHSNRDSHCV